MICQLVYLILYLHLSVFLYLYLKHVIYIYVYLQELYRELGWGWRSGAVSQIHIEIQLHVLK